MYAVGACSFASVCLYVCVCIYMYVHVCLYVCMYYFLCLCDFESYIGKSLWQSNLRNHDIRLLRQFSGTYRTRAVFSRPIYKLYRSSPMLRNSDWFLCHESCGIDLSPYRMIAQELMNFNLRTC